MSDDILSHDELLRYDRQIAIKAMDIGGQERLKLARVLVLGLGGLGCAASQYLAVAGVGHLTLVDFDTVELSNLQRQVLHNDQRIGMPKVASARLTIESLNPHIHTEILAEAPDDVRLDNLVASHHLVLDCSDNIAVRQQLNRACFRHQVPLVSAAAIRMEGMVTVFDYRPGTPCYQCYANLFGEQQLTCVESGVLAPVVGMIGSLQAIEAIKLLASMGKPLVGRVLMLDAMTMEMREMRLPRQPECGVCGA